MPTTAATRCRSAVSSTSSASRAKPGSAFQAARTADESRRLRERSRGASPRLMANEAAGATERRRGPTTQQLRRLVERAQQGDRDALEELYLVHFDRIYSYLHMSVGNRHDAED